MTPGAPPPTAPAAVQRLPPFARAAALALGITAAQVILAAAASGELDPGRAHLSLCQYDSYLYAGIVEQGYVCPPTLTPDSHGNVAFFPGYPATAWVVHAATGSSALTSLLVAAHLACWGFWTYVFLLFQRWRVRPGLAALGCVLMTTRPGSFFLAAGYSEPLFLMSLLGFIYWSEQECAAGRVLAALHGFVLSATRIVGLPVVVYPVLHAWLNPPRGAPAPRGLVRRLAAALAVAAAAALGGGLFLLYCQCLFGYWDLYMRTQHLGWNVRPDYFVFFHEDAYRWAWPQWKYGFYEPTWFSHMTALLFLPVFAAFLVGEFCLARSALATGGNKGRVEAASGWRERAGIYAVAWIIYYISAAGVSRLGMTSMSRYVLGPEVLLALCLVHMVSRRPGAWWRLPIWLWIALGVWAMFGLVYEIVGVVRFTHGLWVA
jgi:hypothetical protein